MNPMCSKFQEQCLGLVDGPEISRCRDTASIYRLLNMLKNVFVYQMKKRTCISALISLMSLMNEL